VLGIVFAPLKDLVARKMPGRPVSSSVVSLVLILVIVFAPLIFVLTEISLEAHSLYVTLNSGDGNLGALAVIEKGINGAIGYFAPGSAVSVIDVDINQYVNQALHWSLNNINSIFSGAAKVLFNLFLLVFALYYVIKDGPVLKKQLVELSPLMDTYDERIFKKLELAVNSVVRGSLIVGMIQGALTGIGFALFGVPNPALWGGVAAITALIPGVGTALVLVPGVAYLFLAGAIPQALGLLAWGLVAVGLIDNFLGPRLIERGIHIHPFFILLSVIGGLGAFGPIGFLLGPLVLALLFALLEIYKTYAVRPTNS
jgi:predicted PurR-regulated permease PerM